MSDETTVIECKGFPTLEIKEVGHQHWTLNSKASNSLQAGQIDTDASFTKCVFVRLQLEWPDGIFRGEGGALITTDGKFHAENIVICPVSYWNSEGPYADGETSGLDRAACQLEARAAEIEAEGSASIFAGAIVSELRSQAKKLRDMYVKEGE